MIFDVKIKNVTNNINMILAYSRVLENDQFKMCNGERKENM